MRQTFALVLLGACVATHAQVAVSGYDFSDTLSAYLDTNPPHVLPLEHRTGSFPTQPYGPTVYADGVVGSTSKRVANFVAPQLFRARHGMSSNGGGSYVNQYSIVYDMRFDDPVIGTFASLYDTAADCGDDAEAFVRWDNDGSGNPIGKLGVTGIYGGSMSRNAWHRIVVTVDCTENFGFTSLVTFYVDGVQVSQVSDPSGLDGRFAAFSYNDGDPNADHIDILGDDSGQNGTGQLSLLVFYGGTLSPSGVTGLGPVGSPVTAGSVSVPETLTMNLGKVTGGNVGSLAADDGNVLAVCKFIVPNLTSPFIQYVVDGHTNLSAIDSFVFKIKAKMTTAGAFKLIGELYNYSSGVYDTFKSATVNLSYSVLSVPNAAIAESYVGANGALKARVKVQQTGPAAAVLPCTAFEYTIWNLFGR